MRPVILITCSAIAPAEKPIHAGEMSACALPKARLEADATVARREGILASYVQCVEMVGGAPLLLPNTAQAEAVSAAVKVAQGLLLTGGGDVAGELYSRPDHPSMGHIDAIRDRTETLAIAEALRLRRPILGICRGIQILNVALGGTLIQDIPSRPAGGIDHQADHAIRIETSSVLASLWPAAEMLVNSSHHQAVDTPAGELRVTARAPDGIVETLESVDGQDILAVQFHPERLGQRDEKFLAFFRWLVEKARK
jgi:putative glutamine amidotransferase